MAQSRKFILQQARVLFRLGFRQEEIDALIRDVDRHLPEGENARHWIPTVSDVSADLLSESVVQDALAAWRASRAVPVEFRSLLEARVVR